MKLEQFINQIRYDFQMNSKCCYVANDEFWLDGCWEVETKKDNKFIGQVFFVLSETSTLDEIEYNEQCKNVVNQIIDKFDNHPYEQMYVTVRVDDNGIHLQ